MKTSYDDVDPFGTPDGERADINDIMNHFIIFNSRARWGDLNLREDDFMARVIVGRKGTGKTVYLRRLQAYAIEQPDIYADQIQQDLPSTESIISFCHWFQGTILPEKWQELWRISILASLVTHLLKSEKLQPYLDKNNSTYLHNIFSTLVTENDLTAHSAYHFMKLFLLNYNNANRMNKILNDLRWDELSNYVESILMNFPPICLYIDSIDIRFERAPVYWLQCHRGLFYEVMRLLKKPIFGSRLHIFIAMRDIVFSSVAQGEHMTKYLEEPHIRKLKWNKESISYFLNKKLESLQNKFFIKEDTTNKGVKDWLGIDHIRNGRGKLEKVEEYIIRHTRCIPRDIVTVGNLLTQQVMLAKENKYTRVHRDAIRNIVSQAACMFAKEQLNICASHISADQLPRNAVQQGYSDIYISTDEYIPGKEADLQYILSNINKEKLNKAEVDIIQLLSKKKFGDEIDVLSILWQNNLIGYVGKSGKYQRGVFKSGDNQGIYLFPDNHNEYLFHSTLLHLLNVSEIEENVIKTQE